jgi:hypothetical protein
MSECFDESYVSASECVSVCVCVSTRTSIQNTVNWSGLAEVVGFSFLWFWREKIFKYPNTVFGIKLLAVAFVVLRSKRFVL